VAILRCGDLISWNALTASAGAAEARRSRRVSRVLYQAAALGPVSGVSLDGMTRRILAPGFAVTLLVASLSGCGAGHHVGDRAASTTVGAAVSTTVTPTTAASTTAAPTTTNAPAATFTDTVSGPLTAADVPSTWRAGCPVPPSDLRRIQLSYFGFDATTHSGAIVVNASVATAVVAIFRSLYNARFPIRSLVPEDAFQGNDPDSMAADNTSGFNCRNAVSSGPPSWSMHAYGEAIDVNPVENPYLEPGVAAQPPAGAAYSNRADIRPGMAYRGGVLVDAFSAAGWGWGGNWADPDYQHFSTNGQ
jgi:hypothetical protein